MTARGLRSRGRPGRRARPRTPSSGRSACSATEAGLSMTHGGPARVEPAAGLAALPAGAPRARGPACCPFYLPQFHPTPGERQWWGEGFTEWTNVTAARPVYLGHNQPNLPADLGLLRPAPGRGAIRRRWTWPTAHGIEGFMYYYYWFAGQAAAVDAGRALLASDVQKPFCLMWANENWTRRWDGRSSDILMGQDYERVPAERFIDDVLQFLADPRYICGARPAGARGVPHRPDPRLPAGDRAVARARPRGRGRASSVPARRRRGARVRRLVRRREGGRPRRHCWASRRTT